MKIKRVRYLAYEETYETTLNTFETEATLDTKPHKAQLLAIFYHGIMVAFIYIKRSNQTADAKRFSEVQFERTG